MSSPSSPKDDAKTKEETDSTDSTKDVADGDRPAEAAEEVDPDAELTAEELRAELVNLSALIDAGDVSLAEMVEIATALREAADDSGGDEADGELDAALVRKYDELAEVHVSVVVVCGSVDISCGATQRLLKQIDASAPELDDAEREMLEASDKLREVEEAEAELAALEAEEEKLLDE